MIQVIYTKGYNQLLNTNIKIPITSQLYYYISWKLLPTSSAVVDLVTPSMLFSRVLSRELFSSGLFDSILLSEKELDVTDPSPMLALGLDLLSPELVVSSFTFYRNHVVDLQNECKFLVSSFLFDYQNFLNQIYSRFLCRNWNLQLLRFCILNPGVLNPGVWNLGVFNFRVLNLGVLNLGVLT